MAVVDELRDRTTRVFQDLDDVQDYLAHSKLSWQLVQDMVSGGSQFQFDNPTTGNAVVQAALVGLAPR